MLDDSIEELLMFVREVEDVCEVPLRLNAMRKCEDREHIERYLVYFICLSRALEMVLESLGKRLY